MYNIYDDFEESKSIIPIYDMEIKEYSDKGLFAELFALNKIMQEIIDEIAYYNKTSSKDIDIQDNEFFDEDKNLKAYKKEFKNVRDNLEIVISEAVRRVEDNIELLPFFLKTIPFGGHGVGSEYNFLMLRDAIPNIKYFSYLNDWVLDTYSTMNNVSYSYLFEKCLNNSTLEQISENADYFLKDYVYFNKKQKNEFLSILITKYPLIFEQLSPDLRNSDLKKILLAKGTISDFENLVFQHNMLNKETEEAFSRYNLSHLEIQSFISRVLKNNFHEEMKKPLYVLEASKNNKTVAYNLSRGMDKEHAVYKDFKTLQQLIIIEPDFAKNAPEKFWDDHNRVFLMLSSNKSIFYSLPPKLSNNLNFILQTQLKLSDSMFIDSFSYKKISHEEAVEGINIIIEYNKSITLEGNKMLNEEEEGWKKRESFIAQQNLPIHFKTLCFLMTKLEGSKLKKDTAFQDSMWSCFEELETYNRQKPKDSKYLENFPCPLYLLAYRNKNDINYTSSYSVLDIISSCYNSPLSDKEQDFLISTLEEIMLKQLSNSNNKYVGETIGSMIQRAWYLNDEKYTISLEETCQLFSVIPADKLQEIFVKDNFSWNSLRSLEKSFPTLNKQLILDDFLTKILETQIINDTNNMNKTNTTSKVLKF